MGLPEQEDGTTTSVRPDRHWSDEEIASFSMNPGEGRVLTVRPGGSSRTEFELRLRDAGYSMGRLPITRDPSHLPEAAATFAPDVVYVTLTQPTELCILALETLAEHRQTKDLPIVALVCADTRPEVIDDVYARTGCDFLRLDVTEIEVLARTHLLVRLHRARLAEPATEHSVPIPAAANSPTGARLDLRDPVTQVYSATYLRHRLGTEQARAIRYQRALSIVAVRCPDAATSDSAATRVAMMLRDCCRDVDLLARMERGVFVMLLPETPAEGAEILVERLRTALRAEDPGTGIGRSSVGGMSEDAQTTGLEALRVACRAADEDAAKEV